jgi:arylsulfatase A-like enzyme
MSGVVAGSAAALGQSPPRAAGRNAATPSRPDAPPNILWVCSDQQRFDTIEGLNNPAVKTPHLRRLMQEAVTFTHAFVQNPVCSPSRASFLTGRYPHTAGLCSNGQRIRETERLVPRILSDFGYTCGLAGKLHLSPVAGGRLEDRVDDGYSRFAWSHDITDQWPGQNMWRVWLEQQGVKWPAHEHDPEGIAIDAKYMQTAWCADRAIDFLRSQRNFGPWLMSVNIYQPHHPFLPAKEFLDLYDPEKLPAPKYQPGELDNKPRYQKGAQGNPTFPFLKMDDLARRKVTAAYYAMVSQVDQAFGRMLQALEDSGQAENTIVIFMSDHGEMLGDHGFYLKGPHLYDQAIRVPLMIRWPKHYRAGVRCDSLVEMVDVAPTLLEAAGIPPVDGMQGRSLTPLLTGATTEHRDSIYTEFYDQRFQGVEPASVTMVRTESAKLSAYHSLDTGELYDLKKDPGEVHNLWADPNARPLKEEMMGRLIGRMANTIDPLPRKRAPW